MQKIIKLLLEKVIIIEEIYWIENHKISTRKIVRLAGSLVKPDPDLNFCPVPGLGPGLPKMAGIPESGPRPRQSSETPQNTLSTLRGFRSQIRSSKKSKKLAPSQGGG